MQSTLATLIAFSTILGAGALHAAVVRCPADLSSPHLGFEQMGATPARPAPLGNMRLFDGKPGEETQAAPADLAPDESVEHRGGLTSHWTFAGNESLLIVCTYKGSPTYLRTQPRPMPKRCTLDTGPARTNASCE
jgi:hypothetical protein